MKILLFIIPFIISYCGYANEHKSVLFNNNQYQVVCTNSECNSVRIVDRVKSTTSAITDEINEPYYSVATSDRNSSFRFYEASSTDLEKNKYLRIGYSITGYVSDPENNEEEVHVEEKCAVIDLQTAQIKQVGSARDEICYINGFLSEVEFTVLDKIAVLVIKANLYNAPNKKTKMYLIKGDNVTLLEEKTDDSGQEWYFINYKGKKDLNMWIKAEAVDIPENKEPAKEDPSVLEETSSVIQEPVIPQDTVAKKEKAIETPTSKVKNPIVSIDQITLTQTEQKSPSGGSISLSLIALLLGVFALKLS